MEDSNQDRFQYEIMDELRTQECYETDPEFDVWLSERENDNLAYQKENDCG